MGSYTGNAIEEGIYYQKLSKSQMTGTNIRIWFFRVVGMGFVHLIKMKNDFCRIKIEK